MSAFFTENPLDADVVEVDAKRIEARLERLEAIELAATRIVALMEAQARAQAAGQADSAASPTAEAPPRRAFIDAYKALRSAVRS